MDEDRVQSLQETVIVDGLQDTTCIVMTFSKSHARGIDGLEYVLSRQQIFVNHNPPRYGNSGTE
jgi:hypothetical protein